MDWAYVVFSLASHGSGRLSLVCFYPPFADNGGFLGAAGQSSDGAFEFGLLLRWECDFDGDVGAVVDIGEFPSSATEVGFCFSCGAMVKFCGSDSHLVAPGGGKSVESRGHGITVGADEATCSEFDTSEVAYDDGTDVTYSAPTEGFEHGLACGSCRFTVVGRALDGG